MNRCGMVNATWTFCSDEMEQLTKLKCKYAICTDCFFNSCFFYLNWLMEAEYKFIAITVNQ